MAEDTQTVTILLRQFNHMCAELLELREYKKNSTNMLEKIRAEIADIEEGISSYHNDRPWVFKDEVLRIIDKYKTESEGVE